jgi:hypothetical protein
LSDAELFANKGWSRRIKGSSSLLVQLEGQKSNKPPDFSQIETVPTVLVKACPVVSDILSTALLSLG